VLAETFIREFSDEREAHGRPGLAQRGRRHKLESVGRLAARAAEEVDPDERIGQLSRRIHATYDRLH
jgi:hypothetical protein